MVTLAAMSPFGFRRLTAPALALAGLLLAVSAPGPALAKPPVRPGPVTGLAMTITKPAANYLVSATWNAATDATTYAVVLSNATTGTQLASASVGTTSWSASVNLAGVTQVRLSVTGVNQRSGPTATITQAVADLNAPDGTYTTSWVDRTGTITQTSLTDDGPIGQVTRTVDWGDGSTPEQWKNGNTISHLYAADGLYRPTVTLRDADGNSRVVVVPAIVPGDKTAPTGSFTTSPAKAWVDLTVVTVTQTALSDNYSPAAYVLRWVNWGDGSAVQPWTSGVTATHTYATPGSYTPQVVLKDEAGNTGQVAALGVLVSADTVVPVVKLTLPKKAVADEVSSWKRVLGTATDAQGTGVAGASVLAIEKRGAAWWFYKATAKTWVKAATKAKAWTRAKAAVATVDAKGHWAVRLSGLKKGTLLVKATATDRAGNVSKPASAKAVLTAS
jgi:PKD domain-containing protein